MELLEQRDAQPHTRLLGPQHARQPAQPTQARSGLRELLLTNGQLEVLRCADGRSRCSTGAAATGPSVLRADVFGRRSARPCAISNPIAFRGDSPRASAASYAPSRASHAQHRHAPLARLTEHDGRRSPCACASGLARHRSDASRLADAGSSTPRAA